jgi:signal recognition particle subunit SRP54
VAADILIVMANRFPERSRVAAFIQALEESADEQKAERDAVRMLNGIFDLNDFSEQVHRLQKMGPITEPVEKVPGVDKALPNGADIDDEGLGRIIAMISSMTEAERRHPGLFVVTSWETIAEAERHDSIVYDAAYVMGRLRRVAEGSGRKVQEVISLLTRFATLRQLMIELGRSTGLVG